MYQQLPPLDLAALQQSHAALQAGDLAGAIAAITRISAASGNHPDALFVASQILIAQGRVDDARRTLAALSEMLPANPHIWNALGNLESTAGDAAAAASAFGRAATLEPAKLDHWLNLSSAQIDAFDFDGAFEAACRAEQLAGRDSRPLVLKGLAERGRSHNGEAITIFRRALDFNRADLAARHNLAEALRVTGEPAEALAVLGEGSDMPPVSHNLRAHLLKDLGRFDEAVSLFRSVIEAEPGLVDAPAALTQILPQIGREDEALHGFARALELRPDDRDLWLAAISGAKDIRQAGQLLDWCRSWESRFGHDPLVTLAQGIGLGWQGQRAQAIDRLRAVVGERPDLAGVHAHLAPLLLQEGDLAAAEHHALEATRLAPLDQSGWAWLTIIWRLRGDPREAWLADYDRFVIPVDLELPPEELVRLSSVLNELHTTTTHPPNQSPRGGTQTQGNLFELHHSGLVSLHSRLRAGIEGAIAKLPRDERHPFLSRNTGHVSFAASWSVRLASAGWHDNHIHQIGWLSSACYIALPPEVRATTDSHAGWIQFGVPDPMLDLGLEPRRVVKPQEGTLVLFPSYFWHGTLPFSSASPRMTVAFDAVPA